MLFDTEIQDPQGSHLVSINNSLLFSLALRVYREVEGSELIINRILGHAIKTKLNLIPGDLHNFIHNNNNNKRK